MGRTIFDDIGDAIRNGINEIKNWVYDTVAAGKNEIISFKNNTIKDITNGTLTIKNDAIKSITDGTLAIKNDTINAITKSTTDLVNSSKTSLLKTVGDIRADLTSFNTYEITQLKNSFANDIYGMKNQLAKDFKASTSILVNESNNEINKVKSSLIASLIETEKNINVIKNIAINDTQLQLTNIKNNILDYSDSVKNRIISETTTQALLIKSDILKQSETIKNVTDRKSVV